VDSTSCHARRIKHELPSTLILMVSQFDSAPFQREAIMAGASGCVVKSNAASELIPVLRILFSERHDRLTDEASYCATVVLIVDTHRV
jgi:DNA-binding NarL/FixJ family response regulator